MIEGPTCGLQDAALLSLDCKLFHLLLSAMTTGSISSVESVERSSPVFAFGLYFFEIFFPCLRRIGEYGLRYLLLFECLPELHLAYPA